MKHPKPRSWRLPAILGIAGCLAGYAYYRFIGCSGGCAITSSPYISTLYGGVIGLLLSVAAAPEKG